LAWEPWPNSYARHAGRLATARCRGFGRTRCRNARAAAGARSFESGTMGNPKQLTSKEEPGFQLSRAPNPFSDQDSLSALRDDAEPVECLLFVGEPLSRPGGRSRGTDDHCTSWRRLRGVRLSRPGRGNRSQPRDGSQCQRKSSHEHPPLSLASSGIREESRTLVVSSVKGDRV
jgi:hypothetical protein